MNVKKLLLSWVAGFAVLFLFGGLWHVGLFGSYYYGPSMASAFRTMEGSKMGLIVLADLLRALVMAYLYPWGASKGSPLSQGLRYGTAMGLLFVAIWALMVYAVINVTDPSYLAMDGIFSLAQGILSGVAIALVYGKKYTS